MKSEVTLIPGIAAVSGPTSGQPKEQVWRRATTVLGVREGPQALGGAEMTGEKKAKAGCPHRKNGCQNEGALARSLNA